MSSAAFDTHNFGAQSSIERTVTSHTRGCTANFNLHFVQIGIDQNTRTKWLLSINYGDRLRKSWPLPLGEAQHFGTWDEFRTLCAHAHKTKNNRYILCWSRVIWSYWQRKLFLNDGHASGMNNGAICYFKHKPVVAATVLLFTVQFCNNFFSIVISGDFGTVTETEKDRWRLMCFVRRKQMEGSIHYVNCNPEDNFSIVIYSHILTW